MSSGPIPVRGSAEASLCLLVVPCAACGAGPLTPTGECFASGRVVKVRLACRGCSHPQEIAFQSKPGVGVVPLCTELAELCEPDVPCINPTKEPSQAIDVWGWITLHTLVRQAARQSLEAAETAVVRAAARRLQMLASACIEEALRFYEHDNELPPAASFFTDRSRQQFQQRPELFTRKRLLEMRSSSPRSFA